MIRVMRFAMLIAFVLALTIGSPAQTVDATRLGGPLILNGTWLYRSGDDPHWSQPDYPDTDWKPASGALDPYTHSSMWTGYFWYRCHIRLAPDHPPLSLIVEFLGNPYEMYANGTPVGRYGNFPPNTRTLRPLARMMSIPPGAASGDSLTIAIRSFSPASFYGGWGGIRANTPIDIGTVDQIRHLLDLDHSQNFYYWVPEVSVRFVSIILAAGLIILFSWQRQFPEYLWIGAYFITMTAWTAFMIYRTIVPLTLFEGSLINNTLFLLAEILLLQFAFVFLKQRMPLWLRIYQLSLPLQLGLVVLAYTGSVAFGPADLVALIWNAPYTFLLPAVALWHYRRGHKEAGLLVLPFLLINFGNMLDDIRWLVLETSLRYDAGPFIPPFNIGVVPVSVGNVAGLLFVLSIGTLLLYRFHRTSQDKARAQSELEAARSMQDAMVPSRLPDIAGFLIESAYIPAQEVGGDFFQLHPGNDGSLLVVIGDVSGKGVKAAMLVSMILGVLRRTVEVTRSPAQILQDLNRCIAGQSDGKFATCCCALITPEGAVCIANAGHLSPYCEGREIELPGGLPLGLGADSEYEKIELALPPGKRWLFISDGVVEARSKNGELYGFDRTRTISILPANQIAEVAQQFGQEDDITVLGIERRVVAFA